jgi:hypothetical protein
MYERCSWAEELRNYTELFSRLLPGLSLVEGKSQGVCITSPIIGI